MIIDIIRRSQAFMGGKIKSAANKTDRRLPKTEKGGAVRTRNIAGNDGGCQQQTTKNRTLTFTSFLLLLVEETF